MGLTLGSLFAGAGGIDLGFERAGFVTRWQSEVEPYAVGLLERRFPGVEQVGDIREVVWDVERHAVDVVAGGYPCQPFSFSGDRKGGDDERHLWPEFARCLDVLRPRYAVLENVRGHYSLGFDRVLGDLACLGYDAEWDCLPAGAFGAPHLRERLVCIATRSDVADSYQALGEGGCVSGGGSSEYSYFDLAGCYGRWEVEWEPVEPGLGRVANGVPNQLDRLRLLGNAVVPEVFRFVGSVIAERDALIRS